MRNWIAIVLLVALSPALPMFAQSEGHGFPGKGTKAEWDRANKFFNEGALLYRASNFDGAVAKYKEAIALYPNDYEYFNNLGLAYKKKNSLDEALDAFKKSIELKENSWESWSNLGSIYKHKNLEKEAVDAYEKSLLFNPPAKSRVLIMQNISALKSRMPK